MQVRAKQGTGKFLFEWDPIANRVEMIVKDNGFAGSAGIAVA